MGKKTLAIAVVLSAITSSILIWQQRGRDLSGLPATDLNLIGADSFGEDQGRGNLVGIQPYFWPSDYATESRFFDKISGYFAEASRRGWLKAKTIVTLPEDVGSWLVVADEKKEIYQAKSTDSGIGELVASQVMSFFPALIKSHAAQDPIKAAVFRIKAKKVAQIYTNTFSKLAKKYGVTIVAGSVMLPHAEVINGRVVAGEGAIYNTSAVFGPDGSADPHLTRKLRPVVEEYQYTEAGDIEQLPSYVTPAGRIAVLICADAWYRKSYERLKKLKVDIVLVPSYIHHDGFSEHAWNGPNLVPDHEDYDHADAGKITGDQAWIKYTLPSKIQFAGAKQGMITFLRGKFWELGSDGSAMIIRDGKLLRGRSGDGASIVNSWL